MKVEISLLLLENGADCVSYDIYGQTPLSLAAANGNFNVIYLFLTYTYL